MCRRRCTLGIALAVAAACKGGSAKTGDEPAKGSQVEVIAQPTHEMTAIIASAIEVSGTVEVRPKGATGWVPLSSGADVREGDTIRTGEGAFARVRFPTRGIVEIAENTSLIAEPAIRIAGADAAVTVIADGDKPLVVKAADGSEASIVAEPGQTAQLRLSAAKDEGLAIAVTAGNARLATRSGEQAIGAGQGTEISGDRIAPVVRLLPFPRSVSPGIDARFLYSPGAQIQLTWMAVPGADRYEIQIAPDPEFRRVLSRERTFEPRLAFTPAAAGPYAWRAAAIDAAGRVGEFGFARRMFFETEPPRDLLVAPADGTKVGLTGKQIAIEFTWQSAADATQYRLVVGKNQMLTVDPTASIVTDQQRVDVRSLGAGNYYWGVYVIRDGRESPLFMRPRALTIQQRRPPKANTGDIWDEGSP